MSQEQAVKSDFLRGISQQVTRGYQSFLVFSSKTAYKAILLGKLQQYGLY